jgi:GAF domain-containing protein
VIAIENVRLFQAEQQRSRELSESLEQQTATSQVLQVISSSPGNLEPVFNAMLENATRICKAKLGVMELYEDGAFRRVAASGAPSAYLEFRQREPIIRPPPEYPLGQIAATKQVIHVSDMAAQPEPSRGRLTALAGARTLVTVPMLKDEELVGAIAIYRTEIRPFTDKQIELVKSFASQAVIAIENARLLSELRESLEQQTATADVLQVISSSPGDLQPVFASMLENAARICDAQSGNIYRWDGKALHLQAAYNTPAALVEARRGVAFAPPPTGSFGRMIATKTTMHVADLTAEEEYIRRSPDIVRAVELGGIRTFLAVPMVKDDQLIGAFSLFRQAVRPFTEKQIDLVKSFAAQAVIAIENTRLLTELRESLEQQTATSKVLDVISRSAFDLRAVFEAVVESSVRLCGAERGFIYRFDGELLQMAVGFNVTQQLREYAEPNPIRPGRQSAGARAALERRTIHIPDVFADPEYTYGAKDVGKFRTESRTRACSETLKPRWRICGPRRIALSRRKSLRHSAN